MTTIVLFGGPSDERHVSVASAQAIVSALGAPLAWFWAPDGPVHDVAIEDLLGHQPIAGGSSRGLFFAKRGDKLDLPKDVPYLAEQYISGRELTVGVIDQGEGPFALPPIEIQVDAGRSFDYAGKYLDAGTREICPAKISDAMREAAENLALAAHTVLGCEGYSRTDMIAAGDDHIYFLE